MLIGSTDFAVIFDMDGVIIDNSFYHKQAWVEFCNKYHFSLSDEEFDKSIFGRTNKDILTYLYKRELPGDEISRYAEEKEALYRDIYKPHLKLPDGLLELLTTLKTRHIKTAVATSAPRKNIDFTFDNLEIKHLFDVIVDEGHVARHKPDPEIYFKAAALLDIPPRNCIVIEDSLPGICAAVTAGMHVVAVTTTHKAEDLKDARLIINKFTELNVDKLRCIVYYSL